MWVPWGPNEVSAPESLSAEGPSEMSSHIAGKIELHLRQLSLRPPFQGRIYEASSPG